MSDPVDLLSRCACHHLVLSSIHSPTPTSLSFSLSHTHTHTLSHSHSPAITYTNINRRIDNQPRILPSFDKTLEFSTLDQHVALVITINGKDKIGSLASSPYRLIILISVAMIMSNSTLGRLVYTSHPLCSVIMWVSLK